MPILSSCEESLTLQTTSYDQLLVSWHHLTSGAPVSSQTNLYICFQKRWDPAHWYTRGDLDLPVPTYTPTHPRQWSCQRLGSSLFERLIPGSPSTDLSPRLLPVSASTARRPQPHRGSIRMLLLVTRSYYIYDFPPARNMKSPVIFISADI